ncbi:unnamed protein product [Eruca vesicaria subsp. sativa]|uniref:Uncharacterized protein n=1 Tax=Eruca vesicaria subsp. sativa TaxID=29727 RepID=A0ABC8KPQ0_ERUVS|nr:unnamed protein product [Eruca vesicaria subsp. sativa]
MVKDLDSKWVRVAEKEHKKYHNTRRGYHGEEEGSRHRSVRREQTRSHCQGDQVRPSGDLRRDRGAHNKARVEVREEGEIKELKKPYDKNEKVQGQEPPSQAFFDELMETQAKSPKVTSDLLGEEQGLNSAQRVLEEGNNVLAEEDVVVEINGQKHLEDVEGKEKDTGEMAKQQGTRRRPLKPSLISKSSNKLKMAQMVASKRAVAKPAIRYGDHAKQTEEKGTSNPKHDPAKH